MLRAELVTTPERLEAVREAWDALAVEQRRPFCAPAWQLAWWRRARPPGAALRACLAFEEDELVGVAPFYASTDGVYRLLAAAVSAPVEPLVRPGREREVTAAVVPQLARAGPPVARVLLEGIPRQSPWPGLLAEAWPGLWSGVRLTLPAPGVRLAAPSYDEWLAAKTSHFRKRMRAARRKLEADGAAFRLAATEAEIVAALPGLVDLHRRRWEGRGDPLDDQSRAMLAEAAGELGGGRLRLWSLNAGDAVVAAELFLEAGGEVASWLGAFDERWARSQPSVQTLLAAIEHGFDRGDRRLDLGQGGQGYKYRLADHELVLDWVTLVPRGRGYARRRLAYAPEQLHSFASRTVSRRTKDVMKRLVRRNA